MSKLVDILESMKTSFIVISGPFGTTVEQHVRKDWQSNDPKIIAQAKEVMFNKRLGAGVSALLRPESHIYLKNILSQYVDAVSAQQPLAVIAPSFGLTQEHLKLASNEIGFFPDLAKRGAILVQQATRLARQAVEKSDRSFENTVIGMSVRPPFESYRAELTPQNVDQEYLPQVFSAVRATGLDFLLFETIPSTEAAIGAARAFTQAHKDLDISYLKSIGSRADLISYFEESLLDAQSMLADYGGSRIIEQVWAGYESHRHRFNPIERRMDYILSFTAEKNGTLGGAAINEAIDKIYNVIEEEGLFKPVGIGFNCNSPEVTEQVLNTLSEENVNRLVSMHMNASSRNDPRTYELMTEIEAIPAFGFSNRAAALAGKYNINMVGGCCGTDSTHMQLLQSLQTLISNTKL